jgi:hypothetical protein
MNTLKRERKLNFCSVYVQCVGKMDSLSQIETDYFQTVVPVFPSFYFSPLTSGKSAQRFSKSTIFFKKNEGD